MIFSGIPQPPPADSHPLLRVTPSTDGLSHTHTRTRSRLSYVEFPIAASLTDRVRSMIFKLFCN